MSLRCGCADHCVQCRCFQRGCANQFSARGYKNSVEWGCADQCLECEYQCFQCGCAGQCYSVAVKMSFLSAAVQAGVCCVKFCEVFLGYQNTMFQTVLKSHKCYF